SEEAYLVFFQEEDTLTEFLILKNSQGNLFRTPIPPEFPHFYTISILEKAPEEVIDLLKSEFGEILIANLLIKKRDPEYFKNHFPNLSTTTRNYIKLKVPEDFERWVYKVKPKNQEKFGKILKELVKGRVDVVPISDPLDVQQKVESALSKTTNLPLLSRNLVVTTLFELQTVGFDFNYYSFKVEEWEIGAILSLIYFNTLYVIFQWTFYEHSKYDIEDLLVLAMLKEASIIKVNELMILQDLKSSAIPSESVNICDLYLSK
ncbi:MAG: hypothetical protein QMD82_02585, partial [bacterium]|nr:hypothetical protein [bacterium]